MISFHFHGKDRNWMSLFVQTSQHAMPGGVGRSRYGTHYAWLPYDIHARVLKFSEGTVSNSGTPKPNNQCCRYWLPAMSSASSVYFFFFFFSFCWGFEMSDTQKENWFRFCGLELEMEGEAREGRSLAENPTWAVATVITVMVSFGFFFHSSLKRCGKVKKN